MTQNFANYINGEWVSGAKTFENRNPANIDEVVGTFAKATAQDMHDAAAAAAAALPAWSGMSGPARGNILYKAADILDRKFDSVAADMTREEGKTLPEAKGRSPPRHQYSSLFRRRGIAHAGHAGALGARSCTHVRVAEADSGVVGLITPWNFPSAIPAWKLAKPAR